MWYLRIANSLCSDVSPVQLCTGLFHVMKKLIGIIFLLPVDSRVDVFARPIFATASLRLLPFSAKFSSVCSVGTNIRLSDPLFFSPPRPLLLKGVTSMSLTRHIGYGRYRLEDFLPGERFARDDGSLALVCDPQPFPLSADQIQIWVDRGTSNARKVLLHRTALAYAVTEEQAWMIERRRKDTKNVQPLLPE